MKYFRFKGDNGICKNVNIKFNYINYLFTNNKFELEKDDLIKIEMNVKVGEINYSVYKNNKFLFNVVMLQDIRLVMESELNPNINVSIEHDIKSILNNSYDV